PAPGGAGTRQWAASATTWTPCSWASARAACLGIGWSSATRTCRDIIPLRWPSLRSHPLHRQPHFLEEGVRPRLYPEPPLDPRQHQPLPRPRHPHIQEPPSLLDLRLPMLRRLATPWNLLILHSHDVHVHKLH